MQFKFYIIDNLEYLEVWENGMRINTITKPFCESVLKLANDDTLSRSALGLFARNTLLYWAGEQELDDKALFTVIPTLRVAIENRQGKLIEVLYPIHFNDIVFYVILKINQEITHKRLWVIRCNRCKRLFPNYKNGRKVMYCNYKNEHGESCHDIISYYAEGRNKTEYEHHLQKLYIRYYDEQRRKCKRKLITKEQVAIWSKNARKIRDTCIAGEITEEDFIKWLDENKENYLEEDE